MAACEEKRVQDSMGVRGEHGERPEQVNPGTYRGRGLCFLMLPAWGHNTRGGSVHRTHFLASLTAFNATCNQCYRVIRR